MSATSIPSCSVRSSRSRRFWPRRSTAPARRRSGSRSHWRRGSRSAPSRPASSGPSFGACRRSRPMPPATRQTRWRAPRQPRSSSPGSVAASTICRPRDWHHESSSSRKRPRCSRSPRERLSRRAPPPIVRETPTQRCSNEHRVRSALDPDMLARLLDAVDTLGAALERARLLAARLEAPVRARVDAGAERSARLGEELRRLGATEVEVRQRADEANETGDRDPGRAGTSRCRGRGGTAPP